MVGCTIQRRVMFLKKLILEIEWPLNFLEKSDIVLARARKIKIDEVYIEVKDKVKVMEKFLERYKLDWNEIAYIGNDINDLSLLQKSGISFAPFDAQKSKKSGKFAFE